MLLADFLMNPSEALKLALQARLVSEWEAQHLRYCLKHRQQVPRNLSPVAEIVLLIQLKPPTDSRH
jgi:hypothetical protein